MANQSQNLAAILNNFNSALEATSTAYNSAGSAARENAAYMESLQAQINAVRAEFENLARGLIDSGTIGSVLEHTVEILRMLNTESGQTAVKIALLTGTIGGGLGIISEFGGNMVGAVTAMKAAATGGAKLAGVFGLLNASALPVAAVISILAIGIGALVKQYNEVNQPLEDFNQQIQDSYDKLGQNQTRLAEINQIPWYERTDEIIREKEAIEAENEAIRNQIEELKGLAKFKAENTLNRSRFTEGEVTGYSFSGPGYLPEGQFADEVDAWEAYAAAVGMAGAELEDIQRHANNAGIALEMQSEAVEITAQEYRDSLIKEANEYIGILKSGGKLTDEQIDKYSVLKSRLYELAYAEESLGIENSNVQVTLSSLNSEWESAAAVQKQLEGAMTLTNEQYAQLKKENPELAQQVLYLNGAWRLLADTNVSAALSMIQENGRLYKNDKERVEKTLELLDAERKARQAIDVAQSKANWLAGTGSYQDYVNAVQAWADVDAAYYKLKFAIDKSNKEGWLSGGGGASTGATGKSDKKEETEDLIKQLKEELELEKQILEAQKQQLETQRDQYDAVIAYATDYADKQIESLNEQIEGINKSYDEQLATLEKTNEELDKQIQREKLLEDLASAKATRQLVFKDGQFQYVSDADAISAAQTALDEYDRQQALESQRQYIESQRDLEVKALEDEIDRWEKYKAGWEDVTDAYERAQGEQALALQNGTSIEKMNWEQRLSALSSFKSQYVSLMGEITAAQTRLDSLSNASSLLGASGAEVTITKGNRVDTSRDYYGEALAAADRGNLDEAAELIALRGQKIEQQGGNDRGTSQAEAWANVANRYQAATGKKYASGTLSATGGLSLVGERGPELRVMRNGDGVLPADITKNLWNWGKINPAILKGGSMGGNTFTFGNISLPGVTDAQSFVSGIKRLAYQRAYKRT